MTLLTSPYAIILIVAAVVSAILAFEGWARRKMPGGLPFSLLMTAVVVWALAGAWEAAVVDIPLKILAAKFQYIGIVSVSPLWLLFALSYTRRDRWLKKRNVAALWVLPVVIFLLAATNELHRLVWNRIAPVSDEPGAILVYSHGLALWLNVVYSYALLFIGTVLLLKTVYRSSTLVRKQAGLLIAGALIPWVSNFAYLAKLVPAPGLDLTPVAFTFTGLLVAWSIFRYRLFDLVPVAHFALIKNMGDGVLVLDPQNRIAEVNPAAQDTMRIPAEMIGRPIEEALQKYPKLSGQFLELIRAEGDSLVPCPEEGRWLDVRTSMLTDRYGAFSGRLVVLRDLTALKTAEQEQLNSLERIRRQQAAVVTLATSAAIAGGDFKAAAREIARTAAHAVQVERVGIWLGNFETGLRCEDLYELSKDAHSEGLVLEARHYPVYFAALDSGRAIDAHDACRDSRTLEFCEGYLRPNGIMSMLDAPVRVSGTLAGVVCFEHIGPPRTWLADEVRFAGEVADQIAQALLNAERKKSQDVIQRREKRLRFITENMVDAIMQIDADTTILFVSPSVKRVFGYEIADVLGKTVASFTHPDDLARLQKEYRGAVEAKASSVRLEYRARKADGSYIWLESEVHIVYGADGAYAGAIFGSRDMTKRKEAEEALRNSLLEKEILLQEIHHRVRNNMQVISSLLNHQSRLVSDPAVIEMFRESQNRIRSIAMVHEKLYRSTDLSRIDFSDYIQALIIHLFNSLQVNPKQVRPRTEIEAIELDITMAIPLGLIVNELITNALKHAFPGGRNGEVLISFKRATGDRLRLAVKDNGVGVPEGKDYERSGSLGLQIVRMLVDQVDGELDVQSSAGGTEMVLSFPEPKRAA